MASRLKEDEKNERIIRSLLKLTPNKRCINCNSLGPQYVCTNFWTFVCTTCSGIHREFTHRVKSVSMAKFSSQEVAALQVGGNKRAKDVFFMEWDSERQSFPDSSNVDKLRDFIKHVYVDRRYTGEKRGEKPPTGRMGDESYENRRRDTYHGGSRSPPYDDTYDRRYSDRPSPGGRSDDNGSRYGERSPGYDREFKGTSDYGRGPGLPVIVNDWRHDDRFGNTQRPERTISNGDSRSEGRSPDHQKDSNVLSPVVRPVRDILGDNVIPLKIDPPKTNGIQAVDRSTHPPRVASSGSLGSSKESLVEPKRTTLGSLIDFDSEPAPPASAPPTIQTSSGQVAQHTSSSNDSNWASFDTGTETKVAQVPSNNLDSVIVQLSVPAPVSGPLSGATNNISDPTTVPAGNMSFFPSGHSNIGNLTSSVPRPPSNQAWNSFAVSMQAPGQLLQATLRPAVQEIAPVTDSQLATSEVKPSGRRELPEDIFAANSYHPSFHVPGPGWQTAPPPGMVFMMPYHTVPHPSFQQPSKSTNPFDFGNEAPTVPTPSFPSMSTLQGALPNIPSSVGLLPNSSLGAQPPAWMTPQSSAYISSVPPQASFASAMPTQVPPFASAMPTHPPSFPSAMPTQVPSFPTATLSQAAPFAPAMAPGSFMGQHAPHHMIPSRNPSGGGFAGGGAVFGSFNQNQLISGGLSASTTPNSSSAVGGNPFG